VGFLVAAYGVIIAALVGYVLRIWLMERDVRGQLGKMEQADRLGRSARGRDNS
jgi:hypothetical protein